MAKLVSTTYGDALFELGLEQNSLDGLYEEAQAVQKTFSDNEDLSKLLNHPKIIKEDKQKIIGNVFSGRVSGDMEGFLHVIVEKDRYNEIPSIFSYFIHKVKEYKGIGTAAVSSAKELTRLQKNALEKRLLETTRYKTFDVDYRVDPSLLGGLVVRIEDRVLDSSLRTQLDKLSKELTQIQLS